MSRPSFLLLVFLMNAACPVATGAAKSVCRGTPEKGALENGCKLPTAGPNFETYSRLGSSLGRTYVHCTVAETVVSAYDALAHKQPELSFIYGETGWSSGGRFRPHKTHQNGLSVDFFVPVRDRNGKSVALPTDVTNKWGYLIEFDKRGRFGELAIDFEAMAAHILALDKAARSRGIGIRRVIFDPELQPFLRKTKLWSELENKVKFSTGRSWVRHDEHYHVDFAVPCQRS